MYLLLLFSTFIRSYSFLKLVAFFRELQYKVNLNRCVNRPLVKENFYAVALFEQVEL